MSEIQTYTLACFPRGLGEPSTYHCRLAAESYEDAITQYVSRSSDDSTPSMLFRRRKKLIVVIYRHASHEGVQVHDSGREVKIYGLRIFTVTQSDIEVHPGLEGE